jgi:octaprenyl-diphosphate synthase
MFAAEVKAVEALESVPAAAALPWKQIVEPVAPFLGQVSRSLAEQVQTFDGEIAPYAEYALTNQGKQLRPALVALSGGTVGRSSQDAVTVAVIIEMIHLATLVHDDVMDEAGLRRRRPTLAANWGNQISVLLGDCLFAHALRLAAGFPTPDVCRAVSAATKTVCSGEILQSHRQRQFQLSRAEYFKLLEMKTGELFALSCDLGGWLQGASVEERNALRDYGLALGTAYQIYDDCLDLFGSESAAGKSLGTDLAKGKLTLPMLVAWDRAGTADRQQLRAWVDHWEPDQLQSVVEVLLRYDALTESRRTIHGFLEGARRQLEVLPGSNRRIGLSDLTLYLAQQTTALGV